MTTKPYRASKTRTNRPGWSVIFRHPVRTDTRGKPGLKVRRGLGTTEDDEAERLVEQLNVLLSDDSWWSIERRPEASRNFDPVVVDIFYDDMEVGGMDARGLREQHINLPSQDDGYARIFLVGTTGAGKTTLLRHVIGSDHRNDRFPSISTARTTTAEIEIVTGEGPFRAAITFMGRNEARPLIDECLEAACLAAIDGQDDTKVAEFLLSHREQRFRLSYLLGSWTGTEVAEDPDFSFDDDEPEGVLPQVETVAEHEQAGNQARLRDYIQRIRVIAESARSRIDEIEPRQEADEEVWLSLFTEQLPEDQEFSRLASDIVDEVIDRSNLIKAGEFRRTSSGWPELWLYEEKDRNAFLQQVRWFSSNHHQQFGRLLTPLVNGMRVRGPFRPAEDNLQVADKLVLLDGEGLGHTARSAATVSTGVTQKYSEVDMILLVDNAEQPMQAAPLALMRSVGSSGYGHKLAVAFTHFDLVKGDNLGRFDQKREHVLGSVRNALTGLRQSLGAPVADMLEGQVEDRAFFLGGLDRATSNIPRGFVKGVRELMELMQAAAQPTVKATASPIYSASGLDLALRDAVEDFKEPWKSRLGLVAQAGVRKEHWARIKALTRRVAGGWNNNEYDNLRPVSDYLARLQENISLWLDSPAGWRTKSDDPNDQTAVISSIRQAVFERLHDLAEKRVATENRRQWGGAYSLFGRGSSFTRADRIIQIYDKAAPPISFSKSGPAQEFVDILGKIVRDAVEESGGKFSAR